MQHPTQYVRIQGSHITPCLSICPTGLGKTHLMKAIASKLSVERPNLNIVYVSGLNNLQTKWSKCCLRSTTKLHKKYRTECDVLLMDDVHPFVKNKEHKRSYFMPLKYCKIFGRQNCIYSRCISQRHSWI